MNERIQELADKIWEEKYWTNPNTDKLLPAQLNRFAELIIAECISIIEHADNGYQDYRNQIEDGMRNHCIGLIKNKFRIE